MFGTALNIPSSESGTNSSHRHNLTRSQSYRELKLLLSDAKFKTVVNLCSITIDFKKIGVSL